MSRRGMVHSSLGMWGVTVLVLLLLPRVVGDSQYIPCTSSQLQTHGCSNPGPCWNACAFWCRGGLSDCNGCCIGNFGTDDAARKACHNQCKLVEDPNAVPSGQTCGGCFAPCTAQQLADKSCANPGTCTNACAATNTSDNCDFPTECRACCAAFAADSTSQQQCRQFCEDRWILPPPGGG